MNIQFRLDPTISLPFLVALAQFVAAIVAGIIAFRTYKAGQRQRKFENSLKLLDAYNKTVNTNDLDNWKKMVIQAFKADRFDEGWKYFYYDGQKVSFEELFGDFGFMYDSGTIKKLCEQFNLIGYQYLNDTIDIVLIYFELGQIIDTVHDWVRTIDEDNNPNFIQTQYPYFDKMVREISKKHKNLMQRHLITV